jgi:hypothetical protein
MEEQFVRHIINESEFFDEFHNEAAKASQFMGEEWSPSYDISEKEKESLNYLLSTNKLHDLVFDSAAIYQKNGRFSSVQIVLKSSFRVVTVRVKELDNELVAEKVVDKSNNFK